MCLLVDFRQLGKVTHFHAQSMGKGLSNGLPLAQQDDETLCCITGATTAASEINSSPMNPPKVWSATIAKNADQYGTIRGDNHEAQIFNAYAVNDVDANKVSAGASMANVKVGNSDSKDALSKVDFHVKVIDANASAQCLDQNGYSIRAASASATGINYGLSGSVGEKGTLYGGVGGDIDIATANALVKSELYTGQNGRFGVAAEAGTEAHAFEAKGEGEFDLGGVLSGGCLHGL